MRQNVGVHEWVDDQNLVRIEAKTENVLYHHLGFIFAEIQSPQASIGRRQNVALIGSNGPQTANESVELAYPRIAQSVFDFVPRPTVLL